MSVSMGKRFRELAEQTLPLQIVGTINAYCAMLAESVGCQAIYLSGAGVANASYGLPDLGMTSLPEVLEEARRITDACALPLLVDVDTAWGTFLVFNEQSNSCSALKWLQSTLKIKWWQNAVVIDRIRRLLLPKKWVIA